MSQDCIELHSSFCDGPDDGGDAERVSALPERQITHRRFFELRSWSTIHPTARRLGDNRFRCPESERAFLGQALMPRTLSPTRSSSTLRSSLDEPAHRPSASRNATSGGATTDASSASSFAESRFP